MKRQNRRRAIIVGAPRSGTTTLWRHLIKHPEIAPSIVKELNYFYSPKLRATSYDDHFSRGGIVTLEASPVYFREFRANASRIAAGFPDARLIFILREPSARLLAGFRSARDWDGNIAKGVTFKKFVSVIVEDSDPISIFPKSIERANYALGAKDVGLYADVIRYYLRFFSPDQIHILFLDDLQTNPRLAAEECCSHIGVDPSELPNITLAPQNQGVEVANHRFFTFSRAVNAKLEPVFNKFPKLRDFARKIHHSLNARPVDRTSEDVVEGMRLAQGWYEPANKNLSRLLDETFPHIKKPQWLVKDEIS